MQHKKRRGKKVPTYEDEGNELSSIRIWDFSLFITKTYKMRAIRDEKESQQAD